MSENTPAAPVKAAVAKTKKPAKKAVQAAKLEKAVVAKSAPVKADAPKRSAIKLPYNLRTRSLVRTIVLAVEGEERKAVNASLRDFRKYSEIRDWAEKEIGKSEFQEVLENWFASGELKS